MENLYKFLTNTWLGKVILWILGWFCSPWTLPWILGIIAVAFGSEPILALILVYVSAIAFKYLNEDDQ